MDFIERLLHVSPDGGSGMSELMIGMAVMLIILSVAAALRNYFPKNVIEFLEQLGKRDKANRFDK